MATQIQNSTQVEQKQVSSVAFGLQIAGVFLFGVLVLGMVGFLPMDVAHNAAHDTRHSVAFPCH